MIIEMLNLVFEYLGFTYSINEIKFGYDLKSFFDFYRIINQSALAKRIKMPQSLLAQYINGLKKPSAKHTGRFLKGVQQVEKELSEVEFML
jgi:predicted transcriptional regulator